MLNLLVGLILLTNHAEVYANNTNQEFAKVFPANNQKVIAIRTCIRRFWLANIIKEKSRVINFYGMPLYNYVG